MRGVLIATVACAVLAADLSAATQAQAQMGGAPTGFGRGNRRPGGEDEKKPQYVPGAKASEKIFPLDSTWTAVSINGKPFTGGDPIAPLPTQLEQFVPPGREPLLQGGQELQRVLGQHLIDAVDLRSVHLDRTIHHLSPFRGPG